MSLQALSTSDPRELFSQVPFMRLLGMQRVFSKDGRARLQLAPRAELGNVIGAVHGGAIATLLDVAMASAAVSALDFQQTAVTLNMNTAFVGPGRGVLTADAQLLHSRDGVAWCQAQVTDDDGRAVAQAQGSFRYIPLPTPAAPASASSPTVPPSFTPASKPSATP